MKILIFEKRLQQFDDNTRERERQRDRLRFLYIVENIKY